MTESFPGHIPVRQALELVRQAAAARRGEAGQVPTRQADGRVLAADIAAPIPLPPFANSAMDGFAFRHADLARAGEAGLELAGAQYAGRDLGLHLRPGQCARVATGAPLPAGADTVVPREHAQERAGRVRLPADAAPGAFVRHAGEDVRAGEVVLHAGQVLTPARIGLCMALGLDRLPVFPRPTVAVLTGGDELVEPGLPLAPGQVYDSNRGLLMAQLRALGLEPVAWPAMPDDPALLDSLLRDATASFDVVLACGGVSAGDRDFLPGWLAAHGRVHFWRVRMRPGMPVLFGQAGRALVLGLPGNPVSVLAAFTVLGRPLLDALQGRTEPRPRWRARLAAPWRKRHDRAEFLRGRLEVDDGATLRVHPDPAEGSHRLRAAATADVLIALEEGAREYAAGELVDVLPL